MTLSPILKQFMNPNSSIIRGFRQIKRNHRRMGGRWFLLSDLLSANAIVKRGPGNIQDAGGLRNIVVGQGKQGQDIIPDEFVQGREVRDGNGATCVGSEQGLKKTTHDQRPWAARRRRKLLETT